MNEMCGARVGVGVRGSMHVMPLFRFVEEVVVCVGSRGRDLWISNRIAIVQAHA